MIIIGKSERGNSFVPIAVLSLISAILLFIFIFRKLSVPAVFILSFLIAMLTAAGFEPRAYSELPWCGLPLSSVRSVRLCASADSRKLSGGGYLLEAVMLSCYGRDGASADAGGRLLVFFSDDPALHRGRTAVLTAGLRPKSERAAASPLPGETRPVRQSVLKEPPAVTAAASSENLTPGEFSSSLWRLRAGLLLRLKSRCLAAGERPGGLLLALISGNRDSMDVAESLLFRRAGCAHVLALSGMHLGILTGLLLIMLRPLPGRLPAFVICGSAVIFYLFLTGFGVSLLRAALMFMIYGFSKALYRKTAALDALLLSFIILVIVDPSGFYSLSFQLSYLAVAGIIIIAPEINHLLKSVMPQFISLPVACSVAAQLAVSILLADVFGELFPVGLISGLLLAPLVTLFIWSGLIFVVTALEPVSIFVDLIYKVIYLIAETASSFPSILVGEAAVWLKLLIASLLFLTAIYSIRRRLIDGISG